MDGTAEYKTKCSIQVEVDDDDEVMNDEGDDGYSPNLKIKAGNDGLDQVDKDTEEVMDFKFMAGGAPNKDHDSADSIKGNDNLTRKC